MRRFLTIPLILCAVTPAWGQYYAEQQYQPQTSYPQQQANITAYPAQPSYPHPEYTAPQPAPAPAVPVPAAQRAYQPGDYGASVITDIRQMNF